MRAVNSVHRAELTSCEPIDRWELTAYARSWNALPWIEAPWRPKKIEACRTPVDPPRRSPSCPSQDPTCAFFLAESQLFLLDLISHSNSPLRPHTHDTNNGCRYASELFRLEDVPQGSFRRQNHRLQRGEMLLLQDPGTAHRLTIGTLTSSIDHAPHYRP